MSDGSGHAMRDSGNMLARPDDEVPPGSQVFRLVVVPSSHTFFVPSVNDGAAPTLPSRPGLAERRNVLRSVLKKSASMDPRSDGGLRADPNGTAIPMGAFRVSSVDAEFRLGAWYAQYGLPSISASSARTARAKADLGRRLAQVRDPL